MVTVRNGAGERLHDIDSATGEIINKSELYLKYERDEARLRRSNEMQVKAIKYFLLILLCYVAACCVVYRFKHPEMSETELFMNIPKAITWQW